MSELLFDDFGRPAGQDDIARTEDVLSELFVNTVATRAFLENDPEFHAVYGPKGCGKSLLLFKKAVSVRQKSGVLFAPNRHYAYAPSHALGQADNWVPIWMLADANGKPKNSLWGGLWIWALYTTVLSLWRESAEADPIAWRQHRDHAQKARGFLKEPDMPPGSSESPYDLISRRLHDVSDSSRRSRGQVVVPDGYALKRLVEKYANLFPPTYLFLDNQDDLYEENPEFWVASALGCFRALREVHAVSDKRIHVFMSLRSEVVEHMRRSAHFPMWSGDLFEIQWQDADLLRVFESRAKRLKPHHHRAPELAESSTLSAFLGHEFQKRDGRTSMRIPAVESTKAPIHMPVGEYLLRHTLRRPRDLIVLGNAILKERSLRGDRVADQVEIVRNAVDLAASHTIAQGYLAEVSKCWPWHEHPGGSLAEFIIKHVRKNILGKREAHAIRTAFACELSLPYSAVDPLFELARLGLVGWPVQDHSRRDGEVQVFARAGNAASQIPGAVDYYLVHPVLYGPPFHVRVVKGAVIGPNMPFRYRPSGRFCTCFLSYGSPDEQSALEIYDQLIACGVECWCHPCDATAGGPVWDEIAREITSADRMLCLCSAAAFKQKGFLDEVQHRHTVCRPAGIIPLALDGAWQRSAAEATPQGQHVRDFLASLNPVRVPPNGIDKAISDLLPLLQKKRPSRKPKGLGRSGAPDA